MSGYTKSVQGVRLEPYFHRYTDTRPLAAARGELFIRPDASVSIDHLLAQLDADEHAEMLDWLLEIAAAVHEASGCESAVSIAPELFDSKRAITDFLYLVASAATPVSFEFNGLPEHWDPQLVDQVLSHIREYGHHSALRVHDDGSLHADLLMQLRVDSIKIDANLAHEADDADARARLEHRYRILTDAGKEHVVHGVEAQADFEWLKSIGYTTFQGLWFGVPVPAQQLTRRR